MNCLVIVDAQNDFLPKGAFNSKDEFMDVLHKINRIRLNLYNCTESDLIKLEDCKNVMEQNKNKLINENIVKYYKCNNDIDDENCKDQILVFPFDKNNHSKINNYGLLNRKINRQIWEHNSKDAENDKEINVNGDCNNLPHLNNYEKTKPQLNNYINNYCNMDENNNCIKTAPPKNVHMTSLNSHFSNKSYFAMTILTVDYHPQLHTSFATTHRLIYKEISRNSVKIKKYLKMNECINDNSYNLLSVSNTEISKESNKINIETNKKKENKIKNDDIFYYENKCENQKENLIDANTQSEYYEYSSFLKNHKINTLTDVLENIEKIKTPKCIYKGVNSIKDIKEYTKINFLNETIDLWPVHCVRNTPGSKIHKNLIRNINDIIIKKAYNENFDSYTIFENDTVNNNILKILVEQNIKSVYICGFIFEYCVKDTALSFFRQGFETYIIEDATASLYGKDEDKQFLKNIGIKFVNSETMFLT
ncbi:nicotinamidase, putative [Plasmodium berghei]|uniref:nicotinamidase n=2 Tax=Plasmodium berghei TaxID=5821 RepID=A0A509AM56_PLABA|nr:nicotinamidase, putative [Plasmodium berghei ANKA]CXI76812.1 nicotinamidase, putative [Plasmodium berghei]SCM24970.1 nicotinamidase, putative [Plasmodium berghei]SCN27223.1 nicotinamidase, putative [Plasmodium berghei]SCO61799.1 nicotinamidase, putative [Plasmodium berghei]SCO63647.1 nicotinamidase, putative [Plasmodium berghei]|eukprot:XP_034422858.1 nicotinamidase, putative [Plasmodium berghei ANKA]